jgi:xanthine dehydrogenase molybdopterin-binding subunit B
VTSYDVWASTLTEVEVDILTGEYKVTNDSFYSFRRQLAKISNLLSFCVYLILYIHGFVWMTDREGRFG